MRAMLVLLVTLVGCTASDVTPDSFNLGYSRGWSNGEFDPRPVGFDSESNSVGFGFTWQIGQSASEAEAKRQHDLMVRLTNLVADAYAAPVVEPDAVPAPYAPHDDEEEEENAEAPGEVALTDISGSAREYLIYAVATLLLGIAAFVKRKTIVEGCVEVGRRVRRKRPDPS